MKIDKKGSGMVIGLIVAIVVVLIIGAVFIFSGGSDSTGSSESSSGGESPKEVYLAYLGDMEKTSDFDDMVNVMKAYISKNELDLNQLESVSASEKDFTFMLFKEISPKPNEITSIEESINGNSATVNAETSPSNKGKITMVKEDDSWKIVKESWTETA